MYNECSVYPDLLLDNLPDIDYQIIQCTDGECQNNRTGINATNDTFMELCYINPKYRYQVEYATIFWYQDKRVEIKFSPYYDTIEKAHLAITRIGDLNNTKCYMHGNSLINQDGFSSIIRLFITIVVLSSFLVLVSVGLGLRRVHARKNYLDNYRVSYAFVIISGSLVILGLSVTPLTIKAFLTEALCDRLLGLFWVWVILAILHAVSFGIYALIYRLCRYRQRGILNRYIADDTTEYENLEHLYPESLDNDSDK